MQSAAAALLLLVSVAARGAERFDRHQDLEPVAWIHQVSAALADQLHDPLRGALLLRLHTQSQLDFLWADTARPTSLEFIGVTYSNSGGVRKPRNPDGADLAFDITGYITGGSGSRLLLPAGHGTGELQRSSYSSTTLTHMVCEMARLVTELDIQQFAMDGAVCLRRVFSERWVDAVRQGIEANKAAPSPCAESLKGDDSEGAYFNDYCNWEKIPQFREYITESPAAEIAGRLMESQVCSIWMPVDPVPLEAAIQFVRGSHLWSSWFYPRKFATGRRYPPLLEGLDAAAGEGGAERVYEDVPEEDIEAGKHELLSWAVEPGDCIVFHTKTVHGAPGNTSVTTHRRVLSTRWFGDDAVVASRPWDVSPPLLAPLQPGDRAASEHFLSSGGETSNQRFRSRPAVSLRSSKQPATSSSDLSVIDAQEKKKRFCKAIGGHNPVQYVAYSIELAIVSLAAGRSLAIVT
ncbi:hypothetical protein FJT64_023538 [Amphibalanus amphitrite]|uniref:Phytanoyl-CoA dioxygenase n=1 Tax=Amphibalanus amphitrite TaxID=1232801 RepID=A0A6A4WQ03_AMPAM|nr:hypothetical protein FJT64_023538 [Amphibalanus amphitrite]